MILAWYWYLWNYQRVDLSFIYSQTITHGCTTPSHENLNYRLTDAHHLKSKSPTSIQHWSIGSQKKELIKSPSSLNKRTKAANQQSELRQKGRRADSEQGNSENQKKCWGEIKSPTYHSNGTLEGARRASERSSQKTKRSEAWGPSPKP